MNKQSDACPKKYCFVCGVNKGEAEETLMTIPNVANGTGGAQVAEASDLLLRYLPAWHT